MRIGLVADTHDNRDAVDFAVETFADADVDTVLHCGDFVAPFSAAAFEGPWAFHAVRGNNDGEWALDGLINDFGTYHGECAELRLDDSDIALYHGTSEALVDGLVEGGRYDYVVRGHTHERDEETVDGTTRVNPGGISIPPAPSSFSVGILDTTEDTVEFRTFD